MQKGGRKNMITLQTLAEHHKVYKETHERYPDYFQGYSIMSHATEIGKLIDYYKIKTVLDYGCGKANAWDKYKLKDRWKLDRVTLYDPGVEQYLKPPTEVSELVICTDVMEHVPDHLIEEVLDDIDRCASDMIFLGISTRPATKQLVDGTNAHATVKPKHWWNRKLEILDTPYWVTYTE